MTTEHQKAEIIIGVVCRHYGIEPDQLRTRSRKRKYSDVRNVIFYFLKNRTGLSPATIASYFDRERSTTYNGCKSTYNLITYNGMARTADKLCREIDHEFAAMSVDWVNHIGTMITDYATA